MSNRGEILVLFGEKGFDPLPLKKSISAAIKKSPHSRQRLCDFISGFVGHRVSVAEMDSWTAASKPHNLPRSDELQALVVLTRDPGILASLAESSGFTVVGSADAELLEIARLEERRAEIDQSLAKLRGLRGSRKEQAK